MSLYIHSEENYSRLYYNLYSLLKRDTVKLSAWESEWSQIKGMKSYKNKAEFLRVKLYNFLKRVFLFNQLAVMNYYEFRKSGSYNKSLDVLNENFKQKKRLSIQEMLSLLGSISYNCVDNNGYNYIGETDNLILVEIRNKLSLITSASPVQAGKSKARD